MRTSSESCAAPSSVSRVMIRGAGHAPPLARRTTAFCSRGLVELTTGNPATSTMSPGASVKGCSVSISAALVSSRT